MEHEKESHEKESEIFGTEENVYIVRLRTA